MLGKREKWKPLGGKFPYVYPPHRFRGAEYDQPEVNDGDRYNNRVPKGNKPWSMDNNPRKGAPPDVFMDWSDIPDEATTQQLCRGVYTHRSIHMSDAQLHLPCRRS